MTFNTIVSVLCWRCGYRSPLLDDTVDPCCLMCGNPIEEDGCAGHRFERTTRIHDLTVKLANGETVHRTVVCTDDEKIELFPRIGQLVHVNEFDTSAVVAISVETSLPTCGG